MVRVICPWCGGYLNALDGHDEETCHDEYQRKVNERGAAKAKAALQAAKNGDEEGATQ